MKTKPRKQNTLVFSGKKGNALIIALIVIVIVGLIYLLINLATQHYLLGEVNSMVQEGDYSTTAKNVTQELTDKNNTAWDNGFSFLIGAILIGFFMAGFTLENNPVILFVVLLLLFFGAYAAMHIVNLYEDISAETIDTLKFEEEFPRANFVMSNLVEFIIGGVVLLGLGVFVNNRIG